MGKIAIVGDIHANLEALKAVLADAREHGVDEFLCTGDVVGYNANPHECIELLRELGCPVVMGNHDYYVACEENLDDFNPMAAAVVEWTRRQLDADELAWLRNLPFTHISKGIGLVHATMDRPETFGYVFDNFQAAANFTVQRVPVCFHGHTHCPMIYEKSLNGVFRIDPQDFKLPMGRKYFINVGSVGQPRDLNPLASYALYDTVARTVSFRRLEYDIAAAQAKIREARLPDRLAVRLGEGS